MPTIIDWNLPVRAIEQESISYKHLTKCQESGSSIMESPPIGMALDLSFITEELCEGSTWEVHPTLTSDHFAVQTSLTLGKMPPPPPPPKRWNHSKADWSKFKHSINEWIATYRPADDIDQLEKDFVEALQNAADASIPVVVPTRHQHKDNWYYCPEIMELNARMNRVHKILKGTELRRIMSY